MQPLRNVTQDDRDELIRMLTPTILYFMNAKKYEGVDFQLVDTMVTLGQLSSLFIDSAHEENTRMVLSATLDQIILTSTHACEKARRLAD